MHARILSITVFLLSYCSLDYQNTSWHTCAFSIQRVFRASAWTVCRRSTLRICLQVADQKTPQLRSFLCQPSDPPLDRLRWSGFTFGTFHAFTDWILHRQDRLEKWMGFWSTSIMHCAGLPLRPLSMIASRSRSDCTEDSSLTIKYPSVFIVGIPTIQYYILPVPVP